MPSYKGHLIGSAATFFIVHHMTTNVIKHTKYLPKELFLAAAFCALGSLFPDIDIKSVGQKIFYLLLTAITLVSIAVKQWSVLPLFSLMGIFPIFIKHRGITHTIWFVTLAPFLIYLAIAAYAPGKSRIAWLAYMYFASGALSHLLLDYAL
jgi:membrane-bound metal-dependent hydrolase YbcI (DUF457 family)